jgi:hypothetical protein
LLSLLVSRSRGSLSRVDVLAHVAVWRVRLLSG